MLPPTIRFLCLTVCSCVLLWSPSSVAGTRTWDGKYDTSQIDLTVAYFVPSDRTPLHDWRDRVDYFCKRIEQFHAREFQGQSTLTTHVHATPVVSTKTTAALRPGDANAIWRRTLSETDRVIGFQQQEHKGFPILLVLSDINWRPLDDFYRLQLKDGKLVFEGINNRGIHHPGAQSGGARAAYFSRQGFGWGLVSADGWRVPYRGSDCVIYHEGCGHTVGLPHPEPQNGSVMSLAQYRGWLSESWLDKEQKVRMAWEPGEAPDDLQMQLFTKFTAIQEPAVPRPGTPVRLKLTWPEACQVESVRVRFQTSVHGPWQDSIQEEPGELAPGSVPLGSFERETPVGYRVDAKLKTGETAEIWGYFQVRTDQSRPLIPHEPSRDLQRSAGVASVVIPVVYREVNLLAEPAECWSKGQWTVDRDLQAAGRMALVSPKSYGARLEIPYAPPEEYRVTVVAEPIDEPHALTLGLSSAGNRFMCLFGFWRDNKFRSAIENIDGQNVGNESTIEGSLFKRGRISQISVTVRKTGVQMMVDGNQIVNWQGRPEQLTLGDYWNTPDSSSIFVGAYHSRFRIYRVTVDELSKRKPGQSLTELVRAISYARNALRDALATGDTETAHSIIEKATPGLSSLTEAAMAAGLRGAKLKSVEDAVNDLTTSFTAVEDETHGGASATWNSVSARVNTAVLALFRSTKTGE